MLEAHHILQGSNALRTSSFSFVSAATLHFSHFSSHTINFVTLTGNWVYVSEVNQSLLSRSVSLSILAVAFIECSNVSLIHCVLYCHCFSILTIVSSFRLTRRQFHPITRLPPERQLCHVDHTSTTQGMKLRRKGWPRR